MKKNKESSINQYQFTLFPNPVVDIIEWAELMGQYKAYMKPELDWRSAVQSMGSLRVGHVSDFTFTFHFSCIGEGNGNPLQCSCLENPRDRGAWWAAGYGVAQNQTWLKWLSSSSSRKRLIEIRADCGWFCSTWSHLIDISLKLISLIMKN